MDLNFVRPECLLIGVDISPYFLYTIGMCGASPLIFVHACMHMHAYLHARVRMHTHRCGIILLILFILRLVKIVFMYVLPFCVALDKVPRSSPLARPLGTRHTCQLPPLQPPIHSLATFAHAQVGWYPCTKVT